MANYLIYIPNAQGQSPALLTAAGLGALVDIGISWSGREVINNGPDGGAGILFYWEDLGRPDSNARGGVFLDSQEWKPEQGAATPRFWIGWEKDRKPTPADLERKKMHAGEAVTLCDGNAWTIPLARQLPHVNGLAPGGGFVRKIKREYAAFYDLAEATLQDFLLGWNPETGQVKWSQEKCWPFSCAALAQNYYLTPEIIDALELLEDESHWQIARVVTQLDACMQTLCQKKTDTSPKAASG